MATTICKSCPFFDTCEKHDGKCGADTEIEGGEAE